MYAVPAVFVCDSCVQAADAHLQELAVTIPEIARPPVKTMAHGMRLRTLPEALEPGSIRSF
jgi:hypothetical protein